MAKSEASLVPRFSGIVKGGLSQFIRLRRAKGERAIYILWVNFPHILISDGGVGRSDLHPSAPVQYGINLKAALGEMRKHGTVTQPESGIKSECAK